MTTQLRRGNVGLDGHPGRYANKPLRDGALLDEDVALPLHLLSAAERRTLAADPASSWRQLLTLAGDGDSWVTSNLAQNPSTTADILDLVADANDESIRIAVASHQNAHHETLATLLADFRQRVRQYAAAHPNLTADDQLRAAVDASPNVQAGLMSNPRLTVMAAQALRQSRFPNIREQMAARDNPTV
jgi:hypothetical protein